MLYSLQCQWLVLSKPLHWNKRSVIESHFGAIPSAVSWFLSMKFLHFYHPYSIPIFKLSIIYLHSLFTFADFLKKNLKIFFIKITLRDAIDLFPLGWLSSVFTPLHKINPFQANFSFLYPWKYSCFQEAQKGDIGLKLVKAGIIFSRQKFMRSLINDKENSSVFL